MKRLFAVAILFTVMTACSDDSTYIPLCECEPDEYCIDDTCYPTDSSVVPAPDESK